MKAWQVRDRVYESDYSCVVFAETRGKAITAALGTDEFPSGDWEFIELSARRIPALDKYYHGNSYMDWDYMNDRIALVKEAGYRCDPDYANLDECERCCAKDWCEQYETMKEDMDE